MEQKLEISMNDEDKKYYEDTCMCPYHHQELTWGPNPYTQDLFDDNEDYLMCEECRYQAAMDV